MVLKRGPLALRRSEGDCGCCWPSAGTENARFDLIPVYAFQLRSQPIILLVQMEKTVTVADTCPQPKSGRGLLPYIPISGVHLSGRLAFGKGRRNRGAAAFSSHPKKASDGKERFSGSK